MDLDRADRVALAFFNLELHIDGAGREIGLTEDLDGAVDVAHLTVVFTKLFGSGLNGRNGESFARGDFVELGGVGAATEGGFGDDLLQGSGRVERIGGAEAVAVESDCSDGVPTSFLDFKDDVDPAGSVLHVLDLTDLLWIDVLDFHVEIALRAVIFAELLAVGAILLGVETAAADEPGPLIPAVFAGLEIGRRPEVITLKGRSALEAEIVDLQLNAFVNDNRDDLAADNIALLGGDAGERALLPEFVLELDFGAAQLGQVERFTNLHVLDLGPAEPTGLADEPVAADVFNGFQDRTSYDRDNDVHCAGGRVDSGLDRGLIEATSGVKGADRVGDGVLGVGLTFAQGDEAKDELFRDGRALLLDLDGAHERILRRRGGLGCTDERR